MANWASVANLGDPSSADWQSKNLKTIEPVKGQKWTVYAPAAAAFEGLIGDLIQRGYQPQSSGGFNYRKIRGSDKLSQHAFGTAIDLNAMTNAMGQKATDIPDAAALAKKWNLDWGGNWKDRPDPMHFEYTGVNSEARPDQGPPAPAPVTRQSMYPNMPPLSQPPSTPDNPWPTAVPVKPVQGPPMNADDQGPSRDDLAAAAAGLPATKENMGARFAKGLKNMANPYTAQANPYAIDQKQAVLAAEAPIPTAGGEAGDQRNQLAMTLARLNAGKLYG